MSLPFRVAVFGGVYSNYLALAEAIADARGRGAEAFYCLGDMGAFGPHPDRAIELLRREGVVCVQGNYDDSIGRSLSDCQCGYTDPRDNYFAKLSYDYTLANTSAEHRVWLSNLPTELRPDWPGLRALLCHGSPRRTNEFLWESTASTHFLEYLADLHRADLILATHTGIRWQRALSGGRKFVNVGVLGRPENDGRTNVWYTFLSLDERGAATAEFVPVEYDYRRLADEMRSEGLPVEFVDTVLTGWWTTCLEVLPAVERRRGQW